MKIRFAARSTNGHPTEIPMRTNRNYVVEPEQKRSCFSALLLRLLLDIAWISPVLQF